MSHSSIATWLMLTNVHYIRFASLVASLNLFKAALDGVLRSPVSFFDTTPMGMYILLDIKFLLQNLFPGRILSRLSKDQDTLDTQLSMTLYQVCGIATSNVTDSHLFAIVPFDIQFRHRNRKYCTIVDDSVAEMVWLGRPCLLYIPVSRHYFRPAVCALLDRCNVLQTHICGNKALGFDHALYFIWIVFGLVLPLLRSKCGWLDDLLDRNVNWAFDRSCLQRPSVYFAFGCIAPLGTKYHDRIDP
jgi:ABC-type multidrug transport system fused ATPase/permease subunit